MKKLKERLKMAILNLLVAIFAFIASIVLSVTVVEWFAVNIIVVILGASIVFALAIVISYYREYRRLKSQNNDNNDNNQSNSL